MHKLFKRVKTIFAGAAFRVVFSFSNLIISLFVIRSQGIAVWGEVVYYLLILDLAFVVINWGHAPYLTREFSLTPSAMSKQFLQSFISRLCLLLVGAILLWLIPMQASIKGLLTLWAASRFVYQAFYPVIQHERNFLSSIVIEVIGILIVVVPLIGSDLDVSIRQLLSLYAISYLAKAAIVVILNRRLFASKHDLSLPVVKDYLISAFPFLLLSLSAMLQQRADLYVVAVFLRPEQVAQYQVFINLLLFGQLGASLLLSPFSKNIFRLSTISFQKFEKRFMWAGVIFSLGTIVLIHLIIRFVYSLEMSWVFYFIGYFYVLMFYLYLLRNYHLGKTYRQIRVAVYSFIGFGINVVLSYALTPQFGLEGALFAALLTQIFIAVLYHTNPFLKPAYATR